MNFRTPYNHDRAISALFGTVNNEDTMAEQSHAKDTDINVIMAKYKITGQIPLPQVPARYGDFSQVTDYREALHTIREANDLFMELPANIRARFRNDPSAFMDFMADPDNADEMEKLGLAKITRPDTLTPTPTPAVNGDKNGSTGTKPTEGRDGRLRGGETTNEQN